jgi:hypothetical protein
MRSFVERLSSPPDGTIYLVLQEGEEDVNFYYTLLVPDMKIYRFREVLERGDDFHLTDFGRILDTGAGWPTPERALARLHEKDIACKPLTA